MSRLAAVEGDNQVIVARKSLKNLIESADDEVMYCIHQAASSVGEQVNRNLSCVLHIPYFSDIK